MSAEPATRVRTAGRLAALFSRKIAAYELVGEARESDLHPDERACVSNAVTARRIEFASGRLCARAALADVGVHGASILVGRDRAPLWPAGVVGSITHAHGFVGAVVARSDAYRGVGIDVEARRGLERELEAQVCTPEELDWLDGEPDSRRAELAMVLFSAKEAFYKSQHHVTRSWLGFQDVSLEMRDHEFEVRLAAGVAPRLAGTALVGRFALGPGHIFTGIGIPTDADARE